MKKLKDKKDIFVPLDDYEKELEEFLNKGKYVSANPEELKKAKKMLREAAEAYEELQKTKSITLRVKSKDLIKVKAKAEENNIPYQRLISTLIHQYTEGKITITI